MKLSIAIITHNRKYELLRALDSCIDKITNIESEIIIIDNNSIDNTKEEVEAYFNNSDIKFEYIYSNRNLGVAGGRNKALSVAKGEYVFFLDDDAEVKGSNFFEIACERMDANVEIVAAGVKIFEPESNRYLGNKIFSIANDNTYSGKRVISYNGGAHFLRKEFYRQKLYPSNLAFGSEELYASLSAIKKNKVVAFFDELYVLHLPSKLNRVEGKSRDLNIILNTHIIRKLCYPRILIPILDVTFLLRIYKNRIFEFKKYKEILKLYKERYDKNDANRMSFKKFIFLANNIGITHLL